MEDFAKQAAPSLPLSGLYFFLPVNQDEGAKKSTAVFAEQQ